MRVTPADEADRTRGPWRGWFPCPIVACVEGTSRAGNAYLRCEVEVVNSKSHRRVIVDFLMASGGMAWRLRLAAEAFGALEQYRAGEITPADLLHAKAFARLGIESDSGRNVIREYAAENPSVARRARRDELRALLKSLAD